MIEIRPVQQDDLPVLTALYNHYVRETPITLDLFEQTLEQRRAWLEGFAETGRYRCFVAARDGVAIGWASSHGYNTRAGYDATVSCSIYLAPGEGGQGLGRRLYQTLFDALKGEDIHRLFGGITLPNAASVGLHRAFGFELVGVYPEVGRKFGRFWDVAAYVRPFRIDGAAGGT